MVMPRLLLLQEGEELAAAWKELATFFKGQCNERAAFVLSGAGSKFMTRNLRMKVRGVCKKLLLRR